MSGQPSSILLYLQAIVGGTVELHLFNGNVAYGVLEAVNAQKTEKGEAARAQGRILRIV